MPTPSVVPSPESILQIKKGIDLLGDLLAITLGPSQGVILSTKETQSEPEMLSTAAIIARRVIAVPDRRQDVGAMLLRNLVWRVSQRVGDGGATTAVMTKAMFDRAYRFLTAGVNPVPLQRGLRRGARAARQALLDMSTPIAESDWFSFHGAESDLMSVSRAVTNDTEMSYVLAEIFELLGRHAYVIVQDYVAPYLEREYLQGGRWEAKLLSPYMTTSPQGNRAVLQQPNVALYRGRIKHYTQVKPVLELAAGLADGDGRTRDNPRGALLMVADEISGEALAGLVATHQGGDIRIAAMRMKRGGSKGRIDFDDLAALTGANVIAPEMGRQLENITTSDLGSAQRIEANPDELYVISGGRASHELRAQLEALQSRVSELPYDDKERSEILMRLGRLSGNAAILKIGALTKEEREVSRQKAEQGIKALRAALEEGVLPGGGTAYLHCLGSMDQLEIEIEDEEERMGVQIVRRGLEAPFIQIMKNAKVDLAGHLKERILLAEPGLVFDVVKGEIVDGRGGGILDATMVLRLALETATSGVSMAMSTDTIVLKRRPRHSYEP